MLIDVSYFTEGPRHIHNASLGNRPNPDSDAVNAAIMAYIRKWQFPFLSQALETGRAEKVNAYLDIIDSNGGAAPDDEIDRVIEKLKEPFANFVFFKMLRDSNTQATMTGLVRLKCANDYVAPIRRQVSAWNDMVDMMRRFHTWCNANGFAGWCGRGTNLTTKINALNL